MRWRLNIDLRIALFIFLYSCIAIFLNPHIDFIELNVSSSIILFSISDEYGWYHIEDLFVITPFFNSSSNCLAHST